MNSFITTREAAVKLNISVRRVQALIAERRLPAEKIGNSFAIRESDLSALKDRKNGRPPNVPKEARKDWSALVRKFAGSVKDLPHDLSTNKKYMDGFGR